MPYKELVFTVEPADPGSDILIAQLAEIGFESFEEIETGVKAYIQLAEYNSNRIKGLDILGMKGFHVHYTVHDVKEENWNQVWESSYSPVLIADSVYIRASFHPPMPTAKYQILIDPKMSFGTAHHETTSLMIEQLMQEEVKGRAVLDMGSGTAVLAVFAEMLGAENVVAIDNDPNAVENALENVKKNNCRHVDVHLGTAENISGQFDLILANINKNILIADMAVYAAHMKSKGVIVFSGFYKEDVDDITRHAQPLGLTCDRISSRNSWTVTRFKKQ